jgi:hypothetical protein
VRSICGELVRRRRRSGETCPVAEDVGEEEFDLLPGGVVFGHCDGLQLGEDKEGFIGMRCGLYLP